MAVRLIAGRDKRACENGGQIMSGYQMIALDMDGTLLNSRKEITPKTAEAIRRAGRQGKMVVISTGRCIAEMREYMEILSDVQYMICVSGALIYDCREKKVLYSNKIERNIISELLEAVRGRDIMIHLLGQESIVERDKIQYMDRYHMGIYRPLYEKVTTPTEDIYGYFYREQKAFEKVNFYHTSAREREITRGAICHLPIELKNSEETSLECSVKGVSKGTGLQVLCRHLGIDPAAVIAVGDADNDIDILSAAGLSLAMGNADERIKNMCDAVLPDNDHDGCAEAIERYLTGENRE